MKKILLSASFIGAFLLYVLFGDERWQAVTERITPKMPVAPSEEGDKKPSSAYRDGTFTGNIADAYYGDLQVRAVIQGGVVADIEFANYPNHQHISEFVNGRALPLLRREALAVQHADVDVVTGATQTSQAFQESLTSALNQAKN
jgi:uncharacterized protein with FMN-binding domain